MSTPGLHAGGGGGGGERPLATDSIVVTTVVRTLSALILTLIRPTLFYVALVLWIRDILILYVSGSADPYL